MAAGTVISGGFPGRVAQEVQPNQKCEGCLHYDRQVGRTGACTIGERPWNCGTGEAQEVGYAPLARGAGSYLPDMGNHGSHAPEAPPQGTSDLYGAGSTRPVTFHQVSLGEEHVHVVKSMYDDHVRLQKSQCLLCSMGGTRGPAPYNVAPQGCTCRGIQAETIAKAVSGRMSNALRAVVPFDQLVLWVREVAKAGFRLPIPKKVRSFGSRTIDPDRHRELEALNRPKASRPSLSDQVQIDGNGGHMKPVTKSFSKLDYEAGTSISKAIDDTKHSHVVTGKLAPHGQGYSSRKAARNAVDRLDRQYGASTHTTSRNPNYKPKTLKWEKTSAYGDGGHVAEAGHGSYVHRPESHGQHSIMYLPHGKGEEGATYGGSHSSPAAAHAAAQVHHQTMIGG